MVDYNELLEFARRIVNNTLSNIFDEVISEAGGVSNRVVDIPVIARDYTLRGGKRLRAFLVLIGYWSRRWGSGSIDSIKYLMASIEFLQSYLLVHDDIMDEDEVRRGGPTVHVWFRRKCLDGGMLGKCNHYGISQAITVGDYLESLAIYMFSKMNLPSSVLVDLIKTYTRGIRLVAYGQFLDVLIANTPLEKVGEDDVYNIHMLKTASYTVELPLHLGAIASTNYNRELLEELSRYALPAGIAFQLQDDILGLFGDPKITGKPVGSDVREKKKTLLIIKAYELGDESDKEFLRRIYNVKKPEEISIEDIERIREIVKKTGSLDYSMEKMKEYVGRAEKALDDAVFINKYARSALRWLLQLFIKRKY